VDLEDYYHVSAFEHIAPTDSWDRYPVRVVESTRRMLDLLDAANATATFFVLGWVAERQPALVREVAARGHEIAAHSYWHRRVTTLERSVFLDDAIRVREVLEQITGSAVVGYRAPSFSITPSNVWAFESLVEAGYRYDSSVFPIRRRGYGFPGAPRVAYRIDTPSGPLDEYPMATLQRAGMTLPAAGGGYLRHLPFGLIERCRDECIRQAMLGVFYVHPWEVDPGQPRLSVGAVTRWRHYGGLSETGAKLARLLGGAPFTSFADLRARDPLASAA
jgi:polysaccharide deacetylase family protein (PEP-CTERM system associated)